MHALIDADIICYEFGNMKDIETQELLAWPIVRKFVDDRIEQILNETDVDSYELFLTDSGSNFRKWVATIVPYKGNRPSDKPPYWGDIRQHLIEQYDARVVRGMEADDALGIEQSKDFAHSLEVIATNERSQYIQEPKEVCETIICSRDKDLHMISGWHYQWECGRQAMRKWFVDETDGLRFFYKQLLTGDATDNILGLFGVGDKSTLLKRIDEMDDEYEMFKHVQAEYTKRFGAYGWQFLLENARLLWILRKPVKGEGTFCENEIHDRLHPMHVRAIDDSRDMGEGIEESKEEEETAA